MSSNRHFDEHVKAQFNNYAPDVPPHIWENIIAEKNKKRPAGFWVSMFSNKNKLLIAGLLIALSSGGAWVYFNKYLPVNKFSSIATTDKLNKDTKNNTTQNNEPIDEKVNTDNAGSTVASIEKDNTAGAKQLVTSNSNTKMQVIPPALQADNKAKAGNTRFKNKKHITGLANVLVNSTAPDNNEGEYEGQGTLIGRLNFNAERYTVERKAQKNKPLVFNPVIFLPDCPIEKDAAGNKKYIEFYAGPDYAFQSLHDTANSAYLQKRRESTSFKSGFSAGIRYTKVFNNSMSIRTGINYSQINEKFTLNQGNVVQITYIINANGDTTGSYSTIGTRYKRTTNRYRSVDIPLVLGYELGNGKLHANINAGAIVNIYSWQKGDVLDPSGNPVSITTGKSSSPYQFKTNAGIGFIGAVSVYYKLNNKLHLMAEPYFRYNLSSMNKENITLKQKYHTAGLRLGIRLDLK